MYNLGDVVRAILGIKTTEIVSCPVEPVVVTGSSSTGAYTANDVMGNLIPVRVPKRGIVVSATLLDLDDEGTQIDLEVFKDTITAIASEATWAPSDADMLDFVTEINFFAFDDHGSAQSSEVKNIGKAYIAPDGLFYVQAVTRSTPTIAAGAEPRFQLQIQSFDPDFKES